MEFALLTIQYFPTLPRHVVFIPETLLEEVDALVKAVRPRTSRRSWLVEAIREKVERDRDIE